MTERIDLRDFDRGTKRTAKDFRRILRKDLGQISAEASKDFDEVFRSHLSFVISHIAFAYEAVNAIGLRRVQPKPLEKEQAFFLLHESVNLLVVALRTLRGGSILASDAILRQALELAAVGYDIASDPTLKNLEAFLKGKLNPPKSITVAKKTYEPIGRLYGDLSNSAVHASVDHLKHSLLPPSLEYGISRRIIVTASFTPILVQEFKLGLIRTELVAIAVWALIEAALNVFIERPRLWIRANGSRLQWAQDSTIEKRIKEIEDEKNRIVKPFPVILPGSIKEDSEEVQRLFGTTEGNDLLSVSVLQALCVQYPESFVVRYLLGNALQQKKEFESSAREFEAAWKIRPNEAYDVWERLQSLYTEISDPVRLEEFYRRTLELNTEDYLATHNLGMLLFQTERYEEAYEKFQKAHYLRPERSQPLYNVANALLRMGDCEGAVKNYFDAAECDQMNPAPWHSAGVAYIRMGKLQNAYRAFRHAILIDSGYFASWVNLSSVCRLLGFRTRALLCAIRAQRLSPGDDRVEKLISDLNVVVKNPCP